MYRCWPLLYVLRHNDHQRFVCYFGYGPCSTKQHFDSILSDVQGVSDRLFWWGMNGWRKACEYNTETGFSGSSAEAVGIIIIVNDADCYRFSNFCLPLSARLSVFFARRLLFAPSRLLDSPCLIGCCKARRDGLNITLQLINDYSDFSGLSSHKNPNKHKQLNDPNISTLLALPCLMS